jgi:hypothetical protein
VADANGLVCPRVVEPEDLGVALEQDLRPEDLRVELPRTVLVFHDQEGRGPSLPRVPGTALGGSAGHRSVRTCGDDRPRPISGSDVRSCGRPPRKRWQLPGNVGEGQGDGSPTAEASVCHDDARSTRLVVLDPVRFFLRESAESGPPRAVESAMGLGDSARVPREAPSHLRNILSLASDAHPTGSTGCRCESGRSWSH